ncbi:hypothetical protein ACXR0O_01550 [Verrucomicrobiota bacterium sgz303538]
MFKPLRSGSTVLRSLPKALRSMENTLLRSLELVLNVPKTLQTSPTPLWSIPNVLLANQELLRITVIQSGIIQTCG